MDVAGDDVAGRLGDLIAAARAAGADAADAMYVAGTDVSVQRRLGRIEHLERSEARDLGLRVFLGQRSAVVSTTGLDPSGFADLAEQALAMARVVPEDPYAVMPEATGRGADADALDLIDPEEPEVATLTERAAAAEDAAMAVAGITNSEGGSASWYRTEVMLATSAGFLGRFGRTGHGVSVTVVAGSGTGMQRDYDYSSAIHAADLEDPAALGHSAAERALARLGPARPPTARLPVVYDPRVSASLIGHLAGAASGASVARGTSFLKDSLGARILPAGLAIIDDPRRVRGRASRPFDGEGVATARLALVEDGVLRSWILDGRSARQLGLTSTGAAGRGPGGVPSPTTTNLYMDAGPLSPAELMADIKLGLYVTELIGMGVNGLTGDYSRGAAGFMIRDGALAEPVAEITIAGHLRDMYQHLVPANDLRFRRGTDAPTVRIDGMTMAGA
jgi:PmbA protein